MALVRSTDLYRGLYDDCKASNDSKGEMHQAISKVGCGGRQTGDWISGMIWELVSKPDAFPDQ